MSEGHALVYLLVTSAGSLSLLVYQPQGMPATVEAIWGTSFTSRDLAELLVVQDAEGEVQGGYLPGQIYSREWLGDALAKALPLLGEGLIDPIAARLGSIGAIGVTLVPCGMLAALPLHAATYHRDGQQLRLIDEFDVSYSPSARVLATAQSLVPARQAVPAALAGVGNPMPTDRPLRFAAAELEGVAAFFVDPRPLYEEKATKEALARVAGGARYVHLACHGAYDVVDPLSSRLLLADKERLSLREILDGRPFRDARLVVASACQTAITDFSGIPDEALGLLAGFMSAGTPGVIGTLWSVDDLSTAILMSQFYEYHLRGDSVAGEIRMAPARALRRAQYWLANVTAAELNDLFVRGNRLSGKVKEIAALRFRFLEPSERLFADPYYWAPFVFVGA